MLYVKETTSSVEVVCRRLSQEAIAYHFVIFGVHNFKEKMKAQGIEFASECRVFEIYFPALLKNIPQFDASIVSLLTCHISVCQESDKVRVSVPMLRPMIDAIGKPELRTAVEKTEIALKRVIDFACGPISRADKILDWNMA